MVTFPTQAARDLDDHVVSTLETYIATEAANQIYDRNLMVSVLLGSELGRGLPSQQKQFPFRMPRTSRVMRQHGRVYRIPLDIGTDTNAQVFAGRDVLATDATEGLTTKELPRALYTGYADLDWDEQTVNESPQGVLSIGIANVDRAFNGIALLLEGHLAGTNTDTNRTTQKGVTGIQHLINVATGVTVWGLDRSTQTYDENQVVSAGTIAYADSGLGFQYQREIIWDCSGESLIDTPTYGLTTEPLFHAMRDEMEQKRRIPLITRDMGMPVEMIIPTVTMEGVPHVPYSGAQAGTIRYENLDYTWLALPTGGSVVEFTPPLPADQLLAWRKRWALGIQRGHSQSRRQGVVHAFTDT